MQTDVPIDEEEQGATVKTAVGSQDDEPVLSKEERRREKYEALQRVAEIWVSHPVALKLERQLQEDEVELVEIEEEEKAYAAKGQVAPWQVKHSKTKEPESKDETKQPESKDETKQPESKDDGKKSSKHYVHPKYRPGGTHNRGERVFSRKPQEATERNEKPWTLNVPSVGVSTDAAGHGDPKNPAERESHAEGQEDHAVHQPDTVDPDAPEPDVIPISPGSVIPVAGGSGKRRREPESVIPVAGGSGKRRRQPESVIPVAGDSGKRRRE
jgi:hypothetical protein